MKVLSEERLVLTPEMMSNRTFRRREEQPRSPGVHVQAVNKYLGIAAGLLDEEDKCVFEKFSDKVYPFLPAMGVAWEEFWASQYSESELLWQDQFGELERDGIYGTPDGLWIAEEKTELWECKETTKKIQSIRSLWMYQKQGLSYCAMSGMDRVRYEINFALGDYTRPYQPIGTRTVVEYEEREIESWWKIVLNNKDKVAPE